MITYSDQVYTGERAMFQAKDLLLVRSVFEDGESPLKHCQNIKLDSCEFRWKYPLWYSRNIHAQNCIFTETARAGIWYSHCIRLEHTVIHAPKTFRRCSEVIMTDITLPNAAETMWHCNDVRLEHVRITGDYFGMNCSSVIANDLLIDGNYCFDGAKNVTVQNARLNTKDAFWNCENVTISDSVITGEYFGWNSRNVTLINCTVESLQGFCFIENLVMKNCRLPNTTLAFEFSSVDAEIIGRIDSVKNPLSGRIKADSIAELILDPKQIDPNIIEVISGE